MVSELLIGIGISLLIAILAWGDQIRSIQKDTRELERELKDMKGLPWKDIKILTNQTSTSTEKQTSLSNLMKKRKLKSKDLPKLLELFENLNTSKKKLRDVNMFKYNLSFYTTIVFLICGGLSLFDFQLPITKKIIFQLNIFLFIIPFIFIGFLLFKIFKSNVEEENFNSIIEEIYDILC